MDTLWRSKLRWTVPLRYHSPLLYTVRITYTVHCTVSSKHVFYYTSKLPTQLWTKGQLQAAGGQLKLSWALSLMTGKLNYPPCESEAGGKLGAAGRRIDPPYMQRPSLECGHPQLGLFVCPKLPYVLQSEGSRWRGSPSWGGWTLWPSSESFLPLTFPQVGERV